MEKLCKNCQHFVRGSVVGLNSEYLWGDCMNPKKMIVYLTNKNQGVFMWGNNTCEDFQPIKKVREEI